MPPASEQVVLRGGLTVPVASLVLMLTLEARGLRLAREGDELIVSPRRLLTAADVADIRRWKADLLELLAYVPPVQ